MGKSGDAAGMKLSSLKIDFRNHFHSMLLAELIIYQTIWGKNRSIWKMWILEDNFFFSPCPKKTSKMGKKEENILEKRVPRNILRV